MSSLHFPLDKDDDVGVREFNAAIAMERAAARRAAIEFERAVASGDLSRFLGAIEGLFGFGGWPLAMKRVARLTNVADDLRWAFLDIWINAKMLPLIVGDRPVLAGALRVLLPRSDYSERPIALFRGTRASERKHHLYGFSWSRDQTTARGFAEHWASVGQEAIVLQTVAGAEAILHARDQNGYFDEREIIVDPFKLTRVAVAEHFGGCS